MFPPPDPHNAVPCTFVECWVGPCKNTDRTKCKHYRYYDRCSCGRPAQSNCEVTMGAFVCGGLSCQTHCLCDRHGGKHG